MQKFIGNGWTLDAGQVILKRLGDDRPAGLWITSLPWPRMAVAPVALNGAPTYCRSLGQWPEADEGMPRRMLLVADGANQAPDQLSLTDASTAVPSELPAAEFECFARSDDPYFGWERHRLRIRYRGRSLALAMGMRTGTEWRWWEACGLVVRDETPTCRVVEMSGAIPLVHSRKYGGKTPSEHYLNPWLHKHHWLYGHIQVRLHANGVCEVFARHVNSKYVDEGSDLKPAVPTIGFWSGEEGTAVPTELLGSWDGSRERFTFGDAAFDVAEATRLATPEKPGRMDTADGALIWQPYRGCELYGGLCASERCGGGYILRSEDETILRGMARTIRFSLSLSDRSPRIARYLAPDWWYGLCEEFAPAPLLPVYSGAEARISAAREWIGLAHIEKGFEDGGVARDERTPTSNERLEPGWEGELPYAQFLTAWRYGDATDYDLAMRSAYHFADIIIDHAANLVRMHGFPPIAFALPMNRVQGPLAAFLETGDDFLFDCAEKVIEAAHRLHRNAWPRLAVGRDACYVRSAVLLYRYTGNPHFRSIAHEGALAVAQTQRPNGSFGDQGGGTGIHQWGGYISKPWMGLLATNGVVDYLEYIGDEPTFVDCVRRFADWLMAERSDRGGVLSWGYQHDYWGTRFHQQQENGPVEKLPSKIRWHQDNMARLLGYCALRDNRADYLDAWAESFGGFGGSGGDHGTSASLQFLPWVQAALWRATLGADGELNVHATRFGPRTFAEADIHTPAGPRKLAWGKDGHVNAPSDIEIKTRVLPEAKLKT